MSLFASYSFHHTQSFTRLPLTARRFSILCTTLVPSSNSSTLLYFVVSSSVTRLTAQASPITHCTYIIPNELDNGTTTPKPERFLWRRCTSFTSRRTPSRRPTTPPACQIRLVENLLPNQLVSTARRSSSIRCGICRCRIIKPSGIQLEQRRRCEAEEEYGQARTREDGSWSSSLAL